MCVRNLTSIHQDAGLIPDLDQWVKGFGIVMSYGIDHRHSSDSTLPWLWQRPAGAVLTQPVWELPYASDAAPPQKKKKECEFRYGTLGDLARPICSKSSPCSTVLA